MKVITREYADDLTHRLKRRAQIRRQAVTRLSVQEGKPDRIADLLEEAAECIKDGCLVKMSQEEFESDKYA